MDISGYVAYWYQVLQTTSGRRIAGMTDILVHGSMAKIKAEVSIVDVIMGENKVPRITLSPYTMPHEGFRRVLFRNVHEDIYPSGNRESRQSGEFATWTRQDRPIYYSILTKAYREPFETWRLVGISPDLSVETFVKYLGADIPFDLVEMEVNRFTGSTTVWLDIPNMIPIEWDGGRLQINTVAQYGITFLGDDKAPSLFRVRFRRFVF